MSLKITVHDNEISCICPDCKKNIDEADKLVYCSSCCTELPEIIDMVDEPRNARLQFYLNRSVYGPYGIS